MNGSEDGRSLNPRCRRPFAVSFAADGPREVFRAFGSRVRLVDVSWPRRWADFHGLHGVWLKTFSPARPRRHWPALDSGELRPFDGEAPVLDRLNWEPADQSSFKDASILSLTAPVSGESVSATRDRFCRLRYLRSKTVMPYVTGETVSTDAGTLLDWKSLGQMTAAAAVGSCT